MVKFENANEHDDGQNKILLKLVEENVVFEVLTLLIHVLDW